MDQNIQKTNQKLSKDSETTGKTSFSLPGYNEQMQKMVLFQFCYADMMEQHIEEPDLQMTVLAQLCRKNNLEQDFCLQRLMHNHLWQPHELLVRKCFHNVYGKRCHPAVTSALPGYTLQTERLMDFFDTRFRFRRNAISDEVEYTERGRIVQQWLPMDMRVQNAMTIAALREGIEAWDKDVKRFMESALIADYDPVADYLDSLPAWDGTDHIGAFARRVPTNNRHWADDFHLWFRGMVATWIKGDHVHAHTMTPMLIGRQGDGKSTFCRIILPPELRPYYADRLDFTNRNETVKALSRYVLINIDEFDSLSARQNAFLKHLLQKSDVQMRKLYDNVIRRKKRYAAFIATTNDPAPLTDPTGSRRFLCIRTEGTIDIKSPANYAQLYAQALHEICHGCRTWFSQQREERIQQANRLFERVSPLEEAFLKHFTLPTADNSQRLSTVEILQKMRRSAPWLRIDGSTTQRLPRSLNRLGFSYVHTKYGNRFIVGVKS